MKNLQNLLEQHVTENKQSYYRLAYSYTKNTDDALDVIQESIYKAMSSIKSLKKPEYLKTWFYRIIVNTSLDFLRKQKRLVIVDEESLSDYIPSTTDTYQDIDLQKALAGLPDNFRSVIILRFFEDLKISEIAEILDENVNTIKSRLYSSLEKLRISI